MEQGIGSLSRLAPDGRAFSVQTAILPAEAGSPTPTTAAALAAAYFAFLRRLSGRLLGVVPSPGGLALRLRGVRAPLLAFAPAMEVPEPEGAALAYPISGGLLLRSGTPGSRLVFRVAKAGGGLRATVDLEDFPPALLTLPTGRVVYRIGQAPLHAWVGRRFLRALRRQPSRLGRTPPAP